MGKNEYLDDLVKDYSKLDLKEKRVELGKEIAETTLVVKKLINDLIPEENNLPNAVEDFNNLFSGVSSEEEYLTGLYEDVLEFKEVLGFYLDKVTDMYYVNDEEIEND